MVGWGVSLRSGERSSPYDYLGRRRDLHFPEMGSGLRILLAITLTLALLWVGRLVLIPVVLSGFLAISVAPIVDLLERHRVPRALGAFLALAAFTAALFGVGELLYARSVELAHALP